MVCPNFFWRLANGPHTTQIAGVGWRLMAAALTPRAAAPTSEE
jgi:hypothetical protein